MGNEQSVPAPRRPTNKLSKPRTNNNSSANNLSNNKVQSNTPSRRNSLSTNGSPTKNNRNSFLPPEGFPAGAFDQQKEEPVQKKRMSLFRSKSSQPKASSRLSPDFDFGVEKDFVAPSPVDQPIHSHRWSRQSSKERGDSLISKQFASEDFNEKPMEIRRPPPRQNRMSLQHVPQHNPRLSLVVELPSPEPQLMAYEQTRAQSQYGGDSGPPSRQLSQRTNSETALYAPMRRRSLLQHGVATRRMSQMEIGPSENDSVEFLQQYQDPEPEPEPDFSHLEEIAAIGSYRDASFHPRTETPTEMDYGHIGAFKLGSLRIVNGAASPAPSSEGRAAIMGAEEDCITAGDTRRSIESVRANRHRLHQRSNTITSAGESTKSPWVVRSESPLRKAHEGEKELLTINTQIPLPSFSKFDFRVTEALLKETQSPTKAQELANEYMQDLALSPFSFDNSPAISPRLEATSKHMAVEDELFEPEPATPPLDQGIHMPRSFDSGYGGGDTSGGTARVKGPRAQTPKPLAKADSGYSSNVSLRSFKRDLAPTVPAKEAPPTPPKEKAAQPAVAPVRESFSRTPSSAYSVISAESASRNVSGSNYSVRSDVSELTIRTRRSLPALPPEDQRAPAVPSRDFLLPSREVQAPRVLQKSAERRQAAPQLQIQRLRRKSTPAAPRSKEYFAREESPATSEISVSSSTSSSRWKLGKRSQAQKAPEPKPIFTIQATPPMEQLVVSPPSFEASQHLEERVGGFPIALFPNTLAGRVGLRHSSSKETLGTIFSVGSMEQREELSFARLQSALPSIPRKAPSTIPEHPVQMERPRLDRRNTMRYEALNSHPPGRNPGRQSLPPTPRDQSPAQNQRNIGRQSMLPTPHDQRPAQNRNQNYNWGRQSLPASRECSPVKQSRAQLGEQDFESQLTLESISSCFVGSSPYDIAKVPVRKPVNDRAKSITAQFEADAAARFALSRQKNTPQQPLHNRDLHGKKSYDSITQRKSFTSTESSRARSRPPSTHTNLTAKRSHSMYPGHSPPLPIPGYGTGNLTSQIQFYNPSPISDSGDEDTRRFSKSPLSQKTRPPPVSMQTQRKVLNATPSAPPTWTPPIPGPNRTPPQPPANFTPEQAQFHEAHLDENRDADPWADSKRQWAQRRKSAGETLVSRKSMEVRRPLSTRPSFENERRQQTQPQVRSRKSFGDQVRNHQANMTGYEGSGYSHTYGAFPSQPQPEQEYYSQAHETADLQAQNDSPFASRAHSRNPSQTLTQSPINPASTSTSEMLVLDRYAGGLGFNFEHGYGIAGSAGTRNVGEFAPSEEMRRKGKMAAMCYGVDFSDVPVILQRVDIRA